MNPKEEQFQTLFKKYHTNVFHVCYTYAGDIDIAKDLSQETFIKVWTNLESFRNEASMGTWIYRIAVNTCLSFLRSEKKMPKEEISEHLTETKANTEPDKEDELGKLYRCINRLEENERIIITMVLDEIPYLQIAEISGISEGNLRVRIHRIKQKLTELYNRYEEQQ